MPIRIRLHDETRQLSGDRGGADPGCCNTEEQRRARVAEEQRRARAAEEQRQARVAEERRQAREAEERRENDDAPRRSAPDPDPPAASDPYPGYTGPRCYAPGGKTWKPC